MCESKESTIQSQYLVVDGLRWVLLITCYLISITYRRRNMTALQDRLTRAKDMALKILQDTVYQMVERIPECSNTAVKGAELEGYIGFQKMRKGVEHWRFCQLLINGNGPTQLVFGDCRFSPLQNRR